MSRKTNTVQLAHQFFQQFKAMSDDDRLTVGKFIRRLQLSPYSMLREAQAKGEIFASRLFRNSYLYWSLEYSDNLSLTGPLRIKVLALEKASEGHRKRDTLKSENLRTDETRVH
jgi:predicted DNA-binding ribbon-helix-helix protein